MLKKFLLALLVFALFAGGSAYYIERSGMLGGIGPNSVFYFFDPLWEWLQLNVFTINESKKVELRLALMQERINELKDLESTDQLSKEGVEKIQSGYDKLAKEAIAMLERKATETKDAQTNALLKKIRDTVKTQGLSLDSIIAKAPEQTQESMRGIGDVIQNAYQRAKTILDTTKQ